MTQLTEPPDSPVICIPPLGPVGDLSCGGGGGPSLSSPSSSSSASGVVSVVSCVMHSSKTRVGRPPWGPVGEFLQTPHRACPRAFNAASATSTEGYLRQ